MRLQHQWWSVLVAAVLSGLVGVTAVLAAGGEQFISLLVTREGGTRSNQIPRSDGIIAYVTLLNARDGGINGVKLVWEECETVFDVPRGVECYERLKAKGPDGSGGAADAQSRRQPPQPACFSVPYSLRTEVGNVLRVNPCC